MKKRKPTLDELIEFAVLTGGAEVFYSKTHWRNGKPRSRRAKTGTMLDADTILSALDNHPRLTKSALLSRWRERTGADNHESIVAAMAAGVIAPVRS